jgi:hypothetical protein
MFPVRYELGFYISEDGILHSHCRENHKSDIALIGWSMYVYVSPVKYELGFDIPEDGILHSHLRDNLNSYMYISLISSLVPSSTRSVNSPSLGCKTIPMKISDAFTGSPFKL